jgi:acyl carrier protein
MPESPSLESIEQMLIGELASLAPGKVTPQSTLASLGVDSLKLVSLILVIEQKFGVNLMQVGMKPEDMESVASLAAAVVRAKMEDRG